MKVLIEIPVTFKLRLKATNVFDIESRDMTKMICSPEPIDITKRLYDKIDNEEKKTAMQLALIYMAYVSMTKYVQR